jgi:hypothetical protein
MANPDRPSFPMKDPGKSWPTRQTLAYPGFLWQTRVDHDRPYWIFWQGLVELELFYNSFTSSGGILGFFLKMHSKRIFKFLE